VIMRPPREVLESNSIATDPQAELMVRVALRAAARLDPSPSLPASPRPHAVDPPTPSRSRAAAADAGRAPA